jgi:hypothetical protein
MSAPAAIATIRTRLWIEFGAHEMFASCPAVSAFAKHPYLIYKI